MPRSERASTAGRWRTTSIAPPRWKKRPRCLKAAAFGVALWSPEEIDALTIEMLTGLIKDLNAATRWSGLSVAADASRSRCRDGVGLDGRSAAPRRVSRAAGPSTIPGNTMRGASSKSGEADAVVWISAFGEPPPDWLDGVPAIVLADPSLLAKRQQPSRFPIGRPGRDHDGVVFDRTTGTLVEVVAQSPSNLPSVADALNRIAAVVSPP